MSNSDLESVFSRMEAHLREIDEFLSPPASSEGLERVTVRIEDEKGRLMPVRAFMRVHRCKPPLCMECRRILVRRLNPIDLNDLAQAFRDTDET